MFSNPVVTVVLVEDEVGTQMPLPKSPRALAPCPTSAQVAAFDLPRAVQGSLLLFPKRQGLPICHFHHLLQTSTTDLQVQPSEQPTASFAFQLTSAPSSAPWLTPTPPGENVHLSPRPFDD